MRKIFVIAKPNSKNPGIRESGRNHFTVSISEPATDGKANHAIVNAIAEHLGVPKSYVEIVHGHFSKHKIVEVVD